MIGQDGQKRQPGADRVTVLLRHDPGDLGHVSQVMHDPARQQLAQRNGAEARVFPAEIEIGSVDAPGSLREVADRLALAVTGLTPAA